MSNDNNNNDIYRRHHNGKVREPEVAVVSWNSTQKLDVYSLGRFEAFETTFGWWNTCIILVLFWAVMVQIQWQRAAILHNSMSNILSMYIATPNNI